MHNDLDLPSLRAFRTVVREGSFSNAALALRMPKSTVSKKVADLEMNLGVRLIERSTRQLRVTAEGEVLAARAERLLSEAEDIRRALGEQGGAPKGHLRIAVPQGLGDTLMGGIAARLLAAYPEISLEVHFMDRPANLLEEGFDGALRHAYEDDGSHAAKVMLRAHAVLVATPELAAGLDLTHPMDLTEVPMVGKAAGWMNGLQLENGLQRCVVQGTPRLSLGSVLAARDAVVAGAGVGLLPLLFALPDLHEGRLVRVLPEWRTAMKELTFVYPSAQSMTARLRVFMDFLQEELALYDTEA
jgi:DNA-binding transcriptional LysR family regulator